MRRGVNQTVIWMVEDNANFRRTMTNLINRSEGLTCPKSFSSCESLLGYLKYSEPPDVILMDISLPGMSGLHGIISIKSLALPTDVIMLTVSDDDDNIFKAICSGASGYLLKSAPAAKLIESIKEISHGGAPINPRIARRVLGMLSGTRLPHHDYRLTEREKETLALLVRGMTKKDIADSLSVSPHTVDAHVRNIYTKLQVHTRQGAVAKVVRENIV